MELAWDRVRLPALEHALWRRRVPLLVNCVYTSEPYVIINSSRYCQCCGFCPSQPRRFLLHIEFHSRQNIRDCFCEDTVFIRVTPNKVRKHSNSNWNQVTGHFVVSSVLPGKFETGHNCFFHSPPPLIIWHPTSAIDTAPSNSKEQHRNLSNQLPHATHTMSPNNKEQLRQLMN